MNNILKSKKIKIAVILAVLNFILTNFGLAMFGNEGMDSGFSLIAIPFIFLFWFAAYAGQISFMLLGPLIFKDAEEFMYNNENFIINLGSIVLSLIIFLIVLAIGTFFEKIKKSV